MMLYAPRDEAELAVVEQLVGARTDLPGLCDRGPAAEEAAITVRCCVLAFTGPLRPGVVAELAGCRAAGSASSISSWR